MNITTLTKIVTSDLSKELGTTFAKSLATTAGIFGGLALVSSGQDRIKTTSEKRAAKKLAKKN